MRTQTKTTPQNTLMLGEFVIWIHVFVDAEVRKDHKHILALISRCFYYMAMCVHAIIAVTTSSTRRNETGAAQTSVLHLSTVSTVSLAIKIYALADLELLENRTTRLKAAGCSHPPGIGNGAGNYWLSAEIQTICAIHVRHWMGTAMKEWIWWLPV